MRGLALTLTALGACACAATPSPAPDTRLGFLVPEVELAAGRQRDAARLDRLLVETQYDATRYATRRFWASYFLVRLHLAAALDAPFLTEPAPSGMLDRPSPTAHLVATIDYATRARSSLESARAAGVPSKLEPLTLDAAVTNLDFSEATAYSRLGFADEVRSLLERLPELADSRRCETYFAGQQVAPELRPWICDMVSVHLRERDELEAYRFAILAIEGESRFGHALPREEIRELEDWILNGANVRFVCPRSQTGYVPGRRHSPVSGVAHLDYVAVERDAPRPSDASHVR